MKKTLKKIWHWLTYRIWLLLNMPGRQRRKLKTVYVIQKEIPIGGLVEYLHSSKSYTPGAVRYAANDKLWYYFRVDNHAGTVHKFEKRKEATGWLNADLQIHLPLGYTYKVQKLKMFKGAHE